MASALEAASTVWDYLVVGHNPLPSDLILVCCSNDLRVADRAVQLYRDVMFNIVELPANNLPRIQSFQGRPGSKNPVQWRAGQLHRGLGGARGGAFCQEGRGARCGQEGHPDRDCQL